MFDNENNLAAVDFNAVDEVRSFDPALSSLFEKQLESATNKVIGHL